MPFTTSFGGSVVWESSNEKILSKEFEIPAISSGDIFRKNISEGTELGKKAQQTVKDSNDAGSVNAASVAGKIYAYPLTSDNGYYMYYDTSIISEKHAESLEAIIAACEANNVKFRYALENAWYTASFFFATGCTSVWTMNEKGEFVNVDDNHTVHVEYKVTAWPIVIVTAVSIIVVGLAVALLAIIRNRRVVLEEPIPDSHVEEEAIDENGEGK